MIIQGFEEGGIIAYIDDIIMKGKVFFEYKGLKILNDDILTTGEIENNGIDLIVTSPPYNVDIKYNCNFT